MRQSAEVGIVGAGPAGARAAELLAGQGVDVVLLDPKAPWEKPCGGGLTVAAFEDFRELREVEALARPIRRARVEVGPDAGVEIELEEPIRIISRDALGRWQLDRALAAGARHERARVSSIRQTHRGWLLSTDRGELAVSGLVGADGAASRVRAAAAPELSIELVPTRVVYPRLEEPEPNVLVLQFHHGLVGYLWDFPRPDHRSIGIEVADGSLRRSALEERIDAYAASTGRIMNERVARAGAVIGTAQLGHGDFSSVAGHRFALVGDAAGFADPFTGEGIRNALRSADLLADAFRLGRGDWHETYPALARASFAREFAAARLLRRLLSQSGAGVRLVELAGSSDLAYAFVGAMLHVLSASHYRLGAFLRHGYRVFRAVRANPAVRGAPSRHPLPTPP